MTGRVVCRYGRGTRLVIDDAAQKGSPLPNDVSDLGESFEQTPMVVPFSRAPGHDQESCAGDLYIGRGSRQRKLGRP